MPFARRRSWSRNAAALAFASVLGLARVAAADAISGGGSLAYSTSAQIQSAGVSGPGLISLVGTPGTSAALPESGSILLASFQTSAPSGRSTTYSGTPFSIAFSPSQGGVSAAPIVFRGVLNGTISDLNSSLLATVQPPAGTVGIQSWPLPPVSQGFSLGNISGTLTISNPSFKLSPGPNGVQTVDVTAQVGMSTVPEPATFGLLLVGLGALYSRRMRRNRV